MEVLTSHEQRGIAKGKREGRREGEAAILVKMLSLRFGKMDAGTESRISDLSAIKLENLAEALFAFSSVTDLQTWLEQHK